MIARGSPTAAPHSPHAAVTVRSGHEIDELAVAGGSAAGTAAYVESWFDRAGAFRSQAVVADLVRGARRRAFAVVGGLAAGVSLAADARGDLVLAWKTCDQLGACRVRVAARPADKGFSAPVGLGRIDPSQSPVAAVAPSGEALVGWVSGGHVFAADQSRAGVRFGPVERVSATNYAADLTIAFARGAGALAAWTQGTLNTSVMAARLR
jgi:hypothetical protein